MASTPRLIGTLIVVVLKAKNLPNKRHIGKQDPYCTLKLHADTKRTKAVKRGGQHPEWDEEIRFELFEDVEDELARTARGAHGEASPPPPPPKDRERKVKGGKVMRLLCYADDPREPELIGETHVDLAEVLKKGETDEWYTLLNKDKYSGEIYLELTFWSNDRPPEKKKANQASSLHPQYGGPGSFTPSDAPGRTGRGSSGGSSPAGTPYHDRQSSLPHESKSSIPATNSLAQLNLYMPPYDQGPAHHQRKYDPSMEFGDPSRRQDSYPPRNARPHSGYYQSGFGAPANPNPYDTNAPAPAPDPYAGGSPSSAYYQSSQSTQFTNSLYQPPVASGFIPPQPGMTPAPSGFQPLYTGFTAPVPAATPMPSYIPPSSSMGFHGYQTPAPSGFPQQVHQPPLPQATPAPPPFQHHPNSFPSAVPPNNVSGLPFSGSVPALNQFGQHTPPQQPQSYQQPNAPNQGRPLPGQPPQSAAPGFANSVLYSPSQPPPNQVQSPPMMQATTTNSTGFVAPPPPPPINQNQGHRSSSLPLPPGPSGSFSPAPSNNGTYTNQSPLPVPPQQQPSSQHNMGTISQNNTGGSGRSGLPLPPTLNQPGQVQSAFHTGPPTSSTPLPGPPPPLKTGFVPQQQQQQQQPVSMHQQQGSQQGSFSNGGFQPPYGAQPPQQQQQYQPQPPYHQQQQQQQQQSTPWQPNQPGFNSGLAAPGQYAPGQPSHTPVPQFGAYPPPPQVPTPQPWY